MKRDKEQKPDLEWRENGVPASRRFDDPYFSLDNGLAETRHVFLDGNALPARFRPGFHVAELGFGTGLNLLATWKAWEDSGTDGPLRFTSFEAYPLRPSEMARALAHWPALAPYAERLVAAWKNGPEFRCETLELRVVIGDAGQTLPRWQGKADAWFLDGFSPARNPALWSPEILSAVGGHTKKGGTFATYTAAGHVRRALQGAGFAVSRRKGFGHKRHMSVGQMP